MSKGMRRYPLSTIRYPLLIALAMTAAACAPKGEALYNRANEALAKGDNRAAVIDLKNLVDSEPQNAKARALLGQALVQSGDLQGGAIEIQKAKDLGAKADVLHGARVPAALGQGRVRQDPLAVRSGEGAGVRQGGDADRAGPGPDRRRASGRRQGPVRGGACRQARQRRSLARTRCGRVPDRRPARGKDRDRQGSGIGQEAAALLDGVGRHQSRRRRSRRPPRRTTRRRWISPARARRASSG